jgi:hypothetical protein
MPQDKPLIEQLLKQADRGLQYYGLAAVVHFPNRFFFPLLKKIAEHELQNETVAAGSHAVYGYRPLQRPAIPCIAR